MSCVKRVESRASRIGFVDLDRRSTRWCGTRSHPRAERGDRGLDNVVVLRAEIDVVVEFLTHQIAGGRVCRHEVRDRRRAGVDRRDLDCVVVGVRGPGYLPEPEQVVVRLSGVQVTQPGSAEKIGFGDDRQ